MDFDIMTWLGGDKIKVAETVGIATALAVGCSSIAASQQPAAPVPYRTESYSGPSTESFRGVEDLQAEPAMATNETVRIAGATWLRLRFRSYNLGQDSFITVTSLKDGATQRLDSLTLSQWGDMTAFFNGEAVEIELHVAPGESGIFYHVGDVIVGEEAGAQVAAPPPEDGNGDSPGTQEICGAFDNRTSVSDSAVGRIMPDGCTGWMVSNGANLTAGHCQGANQVLEFNVPDSMPDGTPVNPPPQDQYPITAYTGFSNGGAGDDWGVFRTGVNTNGDLAIERQGAFYRMSRDLNPTTVRENGYGIDGPSPFFGDGPRNSDSQTLQTHAGPFDGETFNGPSSIVINFSIDDENGNSGSPVIDTSNNVTIGIATHAGCPGGSNRGTSFENDDLETALRNFSGVGANIRHLDSGHPIAAGLQDGSVFRPFDELAEAVASVPAGGILSVVAGSYGGNLTIDKPMMVTAPVGIVLFTGLP